MAGLPAHSVAIWAIVLVATAGVIIRPWSWLEAIWATGGAMLLVATGLLGWHPALAAVGRGTDVYLFLVGMMLLSEVAREVGLFDWLAAWAVQHARGSAMRLFLLIYGVGTVVTVFLSNDAAAVVLTPAVSAAVTAAGVTDRDRKLPFLFACAFIANAASFVLPISNPANLVLHGSHMPALLPWLGAFLLPSLAAILATLAVLLLVERRSLGEPIESDIPRPALSSAARTAAAGLLATGVALLVASAFDVSLGAPTAVCGVVTLAVVLLRERRAPWQTLRGISWLILPLVAGLFVMVAALQQTGVLAQLADLLKHLARWSDTGAAWAAGAAIAFGCNLVNNLPAGLVAGQTLDAAHASEMARNALTVGVDLGPNLSITGSLATILWLTALRRDGIDVGFVTFLGRGLLVMPPALLLSLAALRVHLG